MWIFDVLKSLWAAYRANRAAKAAADVPKGQEAVVAIAKDGDDIRGELARGGAR